MTYKLTTFGRKVVSYYLQDRNYDWKKTYPRDGVMCYDRKHKDLIFVPFTVIADYYDVPLPSILEFVIEPSDRLPSYQKVRELYDKEVLK